MIRIDLRTRIFLRALALLWIMILAVTLTSGATSVINQRAFARTIYQGQIRTLTLQMADLVLWDDQVALHKLMTEMTEKDAALGYVFLEHDGKPYVYTSPDGVPKSLLGLGPFPRELATVTAYKDQAGGRWLDVAQALPVGTTVLHLEVDDEVLFWQALSGLRGVLAVSGVVLLLGSLFAWNIALSTTREVMARQQVEQRLSNIHNFAFYDTLTQLPNRRLLNDRLNQAIATCKRSGRYGALMFLDLDNFKLLNDTHGHAVGDSLLVETARRISSCIRETDTAARFGGDEFVIMLGDLHEAQAEATAQAASIAEKIRSTLSEPYLLNNKRDSNAECAVEYRCTSSVGVVVFGRDVICEDILDAADRAMYQAKESGRNRCVVNLVGAGDTIR